jgi:hypothetical protein
MFHDKLDFIKQLRELGALQVKVGDIEVLFPPPPERKEIAPTYRKPIDDPMYAWTPESEGVVPDTREPEYTWQDFRPKPRGDEQ